LSPHRLFDIGHYGDVSEAATAFAGGAFLYYLLAGIAGRASPSAVRPVFLSRPSAQYGIETPDPLAHFIAQNAGAREASLDPHPLFSTEHYLSAGPVAEGNPLLHYLDRGDKRGRSPHPLFDVKYYKNSAGIDDAVALLHYVKTAGRAGDPHRYSIHGTIWLGYGMFFPMMPFRWRTI